MLPLLRRLCLGFMTGWLLWLPVSQAQYQVPYDDGSSYSTSRNRYYANDGTYLGHDGSRYDSDSINNPYGEYGSRYSSKSINNPYGEYGSRYSSISPNNPYAEPGRRMSSDGQNWTYGGSSWGNASRRW